MDQANGDTDVCVADLMRKLHVHRMRQLEFARIMCLTPTKIVPRTRGHAVYISRFDAAQVQLDCENFFRANGSTRSWWVHISIRRQAMASSMSSQQTQAKPAIETACQLPLSSLDECCNTVTPTFEHHQLSSGTTSNLSSVKLPDAMNSIPRVAASHVNPPPQTSLLAKLRRFARYFVGLTA